MCHYCDNLKEQKLYQMNQYANVYISNDPVFGPALTVKPNICPPFSECSAKGMNINIVLKINNCPDCGKRLAEDVIEGEWKASALYTNNIISHGDAIRQKIYNESTKNK